MNVVWNGVGGKNRNYDWKDIAVQMASSGYYKSIA